MNTRRLAGELTSWTLNVMDEGAADEKNETEAKVLVDKFVEQLTVDEEVATILVQEGFTSVEEVAYVPEPVSYTHLTLPTTPYV